MNWGLPAFASVLATPAGAAAQAISRARHLGTGGAIDITLSRIIVSFVICIIIAVLAILLIRQRSGAIDLAKLFGRLQPRDRAIEVVETRRLSPHADICLVRQGDRYYLLVLQQGGLHVLREGPAGEAGPPPCD